MNNFLYTIFIGTLFSFLFTNCKDEQQGTKIYQPEEVNEKDKFHETLSQFSFKNEDLKDSFYLITNSFYSQRNYQPVWYTSDSNSSEETELFFNYINNDTLLVILPNYLPIDYQTELNNSWSKEIQTFLRCASYLVVKDSGLFDHDQKKIKTVGIPKIDNIKSFVAKKTTSISWTDHLIRYKTRNPEIIELHKAINSFTREFNLDSSHFYTKYGDTLCSLDERLKQLGYKASSDSLATIKLLKSFQYNNGLKADGILGQKTLKALNKTNLDRYYQSVITLDYLRQHADSILPSKIIRVNVPSFTLRFYTDHKMTFKTKVIVGTNKNRTPSFSSLAKYIVTNPYWNVPNSIATKEIVYAARRDSTYFDRKKYELLREGIVIRHDTINWSKYGRGYFPFKIRQKMGPQNSLGKVKLLFPNKYSVYIHDTPGKSLFNTETRSYSHGCIRTQYPEVLMQLILEDENHLYKDSLDSLFERNEETYLRLRNPFLISIEYQNVVLDDSNGLLRIFPDLYGRHKELLELSKK
jgi:hypothetical protein